MADAAHAEQHRDDLRSQPRPRRRARAPRPRRRARRRDARARARRDARPSAGRAFLSGQADAIRLGTLYALGHGAVVVALGLAAIAFGALLPDWLDPLMGRIVGVTLVALGLWVMYSIYRYARAGERFRLRSRWMLVFDAMRYGWRRFQARLHGHEHVEPLEMSSYGARTSFGVGMIHGIGAETGTQVLLIAAVGGASSAGLGVPMLFAFVIGLLISNFAIVLLSSVELRRRARRASELYVAIGAVAGLFSLFVGTIFLFGLDGALPDLGAILPVLTDQPRLVDGRRRGAGGRRGRLTGRRNRVRTTTR